MAAGFPAAIGYFRSDRFQLPKQVLDSEGEEDIGHEVDDFFLRFESKN